MGVNISDNQFTGHKKYKNSKKILKKETLKDQSENSQEIPDQQRKDSAQTELSDQNDPLKPETDEKDKTEDVQEKVGNDTDNPLNHDDATELSAGKSKKKKAW